MAALAPAPPSAAFATHAGGGHWNRELGTRWRPQSAVRAAPRRPMTMTRHQAGHDGSTRSDRLRAALLLSGAAALVGPRRRRPAAPRSCSGRGAAAVLRRAAAPGGAPEVDTEVRSEEAPRYLGLEDASPEFAVALGEYLASGARWRWEDAQVLVEDATTVLAGEGTLERVEVPAGGHLNVVGDVHGQFFDLLGILSGHGRPGPTNPYLFNGDFVDRGSFSVETMLLLLAWKVAYPSHVRLGRGNHEAHEMNIPFGFAGEVLTKYGEEAYAAFQRMFDHLPLAHVVNGDVLVVHGGLPRKPGIGLDEIGGLDRVAASRRDEREPSGQLFTDLLWADPRSPPGYHPSERGGNIMTFGPDVTAGFLEENDLELVIRSHEVKDEGFEWQHGGRCLTVFSAPDYCDSCDNKGAVVRLSAPEDGGRLRAEVRTFAAEPRPPFYVPAMVYSPHSPACRTFLSPSAKEALMRFITAEQEN
mmetsp:Transcript_53312/g.165619  ORF Transcript_53312/g.165619 Transcript_53312/m.165619 type:complete len:473 (+) Transcript_53312:45-1463(+)